MTSKKKISLTRQKKRKKTIKRRYNKKGGKGSPFLDSLIGFSENSKQDILSSSHEDLECYQKKFSNIQKCINQECVERMVGKNIEFKEENELLELRKENKRLKKRIKKLKNAYEGLDLHGYLFCKNKKKNNQA
mgnify:CR=1 FL=1